MAEHWQIWVDTGGTFTDCLAKSPAGVTQRYKVLSNSCLRGTLTAIHSSTEVEFDLSHLIPPDFLLGQKLQLLGQPAESIEIIRQETEQTLRLAKPLPKEGTVGKSIEIIFEQEAPILVARLATGTIPTAPLPPITMHLATTRGTNALLEENGAEVTLFITSGFEDLLVIGDQKRPDLFALNVRKPAPLNSQVIGISERMSADGRPIKRLNLPPISPPQNENQAAAVCFLNSYRNPTHEHQFLEHLRVAGWRHISVSSDLARMIKFLPRAETTVVDAYLAPIMTQYLEGVGRYLGKGKLQIMTSAGGLVPRDEYRAKDSLLSGPAGGVVGASRAGLQAGYDRVIGFDMGGTSTDVCRFDGEYDYQFERKVGRARVLAPVLNIETVAAGGGSICGFNGEDLYVGPESAGANPGPACYGAGGPLTVTDVNLLLGRLDPEKFGIPVKLEAARQALEAIRDILPNALEHDELLTGFLEIANERMADAIRKISIREGYDPAEYALVAFGGAGGQHACAIAEKLGITTVLCPNDGGLLSARGLRDAVMERFAEKQLLQPLNKIQTQLADTINNLEKQALMRFQSEGVKHNKARIRRRLVSLRHQGQESSEEIDYLKGVDLATVFRKRFESLFGYWPEKKEIEVVSVKVIASTKPPRIIPESFEAITETTHYNSVIHRESFQADSKINGPITVQDRFCTIVIDKKWKGTLGSKGTIKLERSNNGNSTRAFNHSPIVELELFANRFNSIVEEMGQLLQRTAVSTNVKERLDYSCALLDADGKLVTNAPHIPVHLGALGLCVRSVAFGKVLEPGDMILTNHPGHGGSHLPDITVISPVFDNNHVLLGFVANRAHHAELGGISPGSMPPRAKSLAEEGVVIPPTLLYRKGVPQFGMIEEKLTTSPWPTRSVEDNLADLKAQAAANLLGTKSLQQMAKDYGYNKVAEHMKKLRRKAADAISRRIQSLPTGKHSAAEQLDDGTKLNATIEIEKSKIKIDFSGTDAIHPGNFNATPAIVQSAVIYVIRLLVNEPVPLNEGLLEHVDINLPRCLLNPEFPTNPAKAPPVVGGNVETSQLLVNLLLKPFGVLAASQGTMNNLIFGNEKCSYYETICGGTGAGSTFNGADGVHSHMTNTAITDPEILEWRFPVRLERFAIRHRSGGQGNYNGGDGVVRELVFTEPVTLSLLTQNRNKGPYGMSGGQSGSPGEQHLTKLDKQTIQLNSTVQVSIDAEDRLILKTPGGGGFGKPKIQ